MNRTRRSDGDGETDGSFGSVAGEHIAEAFPDGVIRPEHDDPDDDAVDVAQENGGAGHVLDAFGERVNFRANIINDPLDGRVQELDDENQNE